MTELKQDMIVIYGGVQWRLAEQKMYGWLCERIGTKKKRDKRRLFFDTYALLKCPVVTQ